MANTKILLVVSVGAAWSAACGGSTANVGGTGEGGTADSSVHADGALGSDGSNGFGDSSPNTGDDAGPSGPGTVTCGTTTCNAPDECCVTRAGGAVTYACEAQSACVDAGGASFSCTTKSNCGSQECCGQAGGGAGVTGTCEDTCAADELPLCSTDADCDNGDTCRGLTTGRGGAGGGIMFCLGGGGMRDGGPVIVRDGGIFTRDGGIFTRDGGVRTRDGGMPGLPTLDAGGEPD